MKKRLFFLPFIFIFLNIFSQTVIKSTSNSIWKYDKYNEKYEPINKPVYESVIFSFSEDETKLVTTTYNSRTTYMLRPYTEHEKIIKNKYVGVDVNGEESVIGYDLTSKGLFSIQKIEGSTYMKIFIW